MLPFSHSSGKIPAVKMTQTDIKGFAIDLPRSCIIQMETLFHPCALFGYFKIAYLFLRFV